MNDASFIGRTLAGRFRVTGFIGEGGMATVYRGEQDAEPNDIAIKVMSPELAEDSRFVRRFRREAKAAAMLRHPNTVHIVEFGEDDGIVYLVMECIEGHDLSIALHRDRRLSEARTANILIQICAALTAAHKQSIVHRDLKPDNVMLLADPKAPGGERVKVLDFGIAKILDDSQDAPVLDPRAEPPSSARSLLTRVGTIVGTPAYMSPEQGRAESVDARTDLYSCGVLMYELVTGRTPFDGETPMQVVMRHVNEPPKPPSDYVAIHPQLEAIILKALSKFAQQRHQSAEEMSAALQALLPELATEKRPAGPHRVAAAAPAPAAGRPAPRPAAGQPPPAAMPAPAPSPAPSPSPFEAAAFEVDLGGMVDSGPVSEPPTMVRPDGGTPGELPAPEAQDLKPFPTVQLDLGDDFSLDAEPAPKTTALPEPEPASEFPDSDDIDDEARTLIAPGGGLGPAPADESNELGATMISPFGPDTPSPPSQPFEAKTEPKVPFEASTQPLAKPPPGASKSGTLPIEPVQKKPAGHVGGLDKTQAAPGLGADEAKVEIRVGDTKDEASRREEKRARRLPTQPAKGLPPEYRDIVIEDENAKDAAPEPAKQPVARTLPSAAEPKKAPPLPEVKRKTAVAKERPKWVAPVAVGAGVVLGALAFALLMALVIWATK